MEDVAVETAAGGRQCSQGPQDKARLLPGHRLLDLLHMLLNVWGRSQNTKSAHHEPNEHEADEGCHDNGLTLSTGH